MKNTILFSFMIKIFRNKNIKDLNSILEFLGYYSAYCFLEVIFQKFKIIYTLIPINSSRILDKICSYKLRK